MSPLPSDERHALLQMARRALVEAVEHQRCSLPCANSAAQARPCGVFVTLRRRGGRLRGCIGQVEPLEPLAHAVARCAAAAALEDARFQPVSPAELEDLEIEISMLSPLAPIAPEEIEVGRHGLFVTRGWQRGLLLPQVATEHRWTRERFLEETCEKGGMDRNAWREPGARIHGFTAEIFSEGDLRAAPKARAG